MKLNYSSETDSLYIDLSEQPSVESREISEGIVLDYDAAGNLVGIDIHNASRKVELKKLTLNKLPRCYPKQLSVTLGLSRRRELRSASDELSGQAHASER